MPKIWGGRVTQFSKCRDFIVFTVSQILTELSRYIHFTFDSSLENTFEKVLNSSNFKILPCDCTPIDNVGKFRDD